MNRTPHITGLLTALLFICVPTSTYALEVRAHPIDDLIEGDKRTPPEGEHLVEERPATPSYPLPSTGKFVRESAIETFPMEKSLAPLGQGVSEAGDEWADWSSWDEWSETDAWDDWGDDKEHASDAPASSEETSEPSADTASDATDELNWDEWLGEESTVKETDAPAPSEEPTEVLPSSSEGHKPL